MRAVEGQDNSYTLVLNNTKELHVVSCPLPEDECDKHSDMILDLLEPLANLSLLPEFRITISIDDRPSRVSDYGVKSAVLQAAYYKTCAFYRFRFESIRSETINEQTLLKPSSPDYQGLAHGGTPAHRTLQHDEPRSTRARTQVHLPRRPSSMTMFSPWTLATTRLTSRSMANTAHTLKARKANKPLCLSSRTAAPLCTTTSACRRRMSGTRMLRGSTTRRSVRRRTRGFCGEGGIRGFCMRLIHSGRICIGTT